MDSLSWIPFYTVSSIGLLWVLDRLFCQKSLARWYMLHAIANLFVVIMTFEDSWKCLYNPWEQIDVKEVSYIPLSFVSAIHFYHMIFFNDLRMIHWVHHILMVPIGIPILIISDYGPFTNLTLFFVCGLPGGIDYALLVLEKYGIITRWTEKKINTYLNLWCRGPFLTGIAFMAYMGVSRRGDTGWYYAVVMSGQILQLWNAQYFTGDVVRSYAVYNEKHKLD